MAEANYRTHERHVSELHEAISRAAHVTVEFGTGNMPLFEAQGTQEFNAQNLYVGVNLDSKQHEYLADRIGDTAGFAVLCDKDSDGNIDRPPIPDASVDMVVMANVFGEPNSDFVMHPFKRSDGKYKGNSSVGSKMSTLKNAMHMLKDGGKVVILETNTPYCDRLVGDYGPMVELLENNGLRVGAAVNRAYEGWEDLVSYFAKPNVAWSRGSYMVVVEKPDDN